MRNVFMVKGLFTNVLYFHFTLSIVKIFSTVSNRKMQKHGSATGALCETKMSRGEIWQELSMQSVCPSKRGCEQGINCANLVQKNIPGEG